MNIFLNNHQKIGSVDSGGYDKHKSDLLFFIVLANSLAGLFNRPQRQTKGFLFQTEQCQIKRSLIIILQFQAFTLEKM